MELSAELILRLILGDLVRTKEVFFEVLSRIFRADALSPFDPVSFFSHKRYSTQVQRGHPIPKPVTAALN